MASRVRRALTQVSPNSRCPPGNAHWPAPAEPFLCPTRTRRRPPASTRSQSTPSPTRTAGALAARAPAAAAAAAMQAPRARRAPRPRAPPPPFPPGSGGLAPQGASRPAGRKGEEGEAAGGGEGAEGAGTHGEGGAAAQGAQEPPEGAAAGRAGGLEGEERRGGGAGRAQQRRQGPQGHRLSFPQEGAGLELEARLRALPGRAAHLRGGQSRSSAGADLGAPLGAGPDNPEDVRVRSGAPRGLGPGEEGLVELCLIFLNIQIFVVTLALSKCSVFSLKMRALLNMRAIFATRPVFHLLFPLPRVALTNGKRAQDEGTWDKS